MKKDPTNGPFSELKELAKKAGIRLQSGEATKPAVIPNQTEPCEAENEESLFLRAMGEVSRASWRHHPAPSPPPRRRSFPDSSAEEKRLMEAAIAGHPALQVPYYPEYIEGWIGVAGKRFLSKLRDGMYSIQGQIDLHGLSSAEARQAVEEFIEQMSRFHSCCVKIIHGRGINSPSDRAVLKENLQRWLSTRRMARHVVAYASAPLNDGGVGAIYVLLTSKT